MAQSGEVDVTVPVASPKLTKGQRTRQRIFDAALALFGARGFAAVSLRDIAAEVGITHVTVLHYFASKDDLLVELMVQRDQIEREATQAFLAGDHETDARPGEPRSPGLRWFLRRLQRNADEYGAAPLFLKISAEATGVDHPAHQHFVRRYAYVVDMLAASFAEEYAFYPDRRFPLSARLAAQHLVAIADGAQIQAIYAATPEAVLEQAWAYLEVLGLAIRPSSSEV